MDYIKSENIKVFPAAGRSSDYPTGYLLTEDNLNSAMRSLYPRDFVVQYENSDSKKILRFVIHGYYFEIDNFEDLGDITTASLWATIYLKQSLESTQYTRLTSKDDTDIYLDESIVNGKFKGVQFSTTGDVTDIPGLDKVTLQILSNGKVPEKSYLRFKTSEILNGESSDLISSQFNTGSLTSSSIITSTINVNTSAKINSANLKSLSVADNADIYTDLAVYNKRTGKETYDLNSGTIKNITLTGSITGGKLSNTNIMGSYILSGSINSSGATLSGGTIKSGTLSGGVVKNAWLSDNTISGGSMTGTISATSLTLSGGTLSGSILSGGTVSGGTLSGSINTNNLVLSGGTLSGSTLSGGTVSGGTVSNSTLSNPTLTGNLDCTSSDAKIKTSSTDFITPSKILTNVTISHSASNKFLTISLSYTKGKD